jgi:hypothetical protein
MQQQLNRATTSCLEVELPLVACVQRMDAAIRSTDCLVFPDELKPTLQSVLGWIRQAPPPAEAAPAMVSDGLQAVAADHGTIDEPAVRPPPSPAIKLAPKPSVEVEPKEPAPAVEPEEEGAPVPLAAYIDGVTPLDVRCPGHERLELAIDPAGRLHVVAREEQMRQLHVVEAWARAHRELIGRACPGHWIDPAAGTVCHVFTDRPATVADLHGSELRLHVLAPVDVEGRRGWYAAPLNADVP